MPQDFRSSGRRNLIYTGQDARPITLGTIIPEGPCAAVHCNASGTAVCTFPSGRKVTLFFAEGAAYDYSILLAETAGGTDPTLVAIF